MAEHDQGGADAAGGQNQGHQIQRAERLLLWQVGNPTFADDAARMIVHLADAGHAGVWHVTNQGSVSWYEFAREVMRAAALDPSRVKPVKTRDLVPARPAPRPANSVLDNKRLRDTGIALLDDFRVPLARLVKRLQSK